MSESPAPAIPEALAQAIADVPAQAMTEAPAQAIAEAMDQLRVRLLDFEPFKVELGDINIFEGTQVIYVSIEAGFSDLERLHGALNTGRLAFDEPYPYHPHVTIAQELAPEDVPNAAQFARWRWSEFKPPRSVWIDRLTFVQNTLENCWADLATLNLGSHFVR